MSVLTKREKSDNLPLYRNKLGGNLSKKQVSAQLTSWDCYKNLSKQILNSNRNRGYFRIHVFLQTICRHNAYLHTALMFRFFLEYFGTPNDISVLFFRKSVLVFGVFHFANCNYSVCTVYNQINLNGRRTILATPCIIFMSDCIEP